MASYASVILVPTPPIAVLNTNIGGYALSSYKVVDTTSQDITDVATTIISQSMLLYPIVGAAATKYLMRAWDTGHSYYVYWTTITPAILPTSTTPAMTGTGSLVEIAIVHKVGT